MSFIGYGPLEGNDLPIFREMLAKDGWVYNYWRCHWPRPDVLEAKVKMISLFFSGGALSRLQKEYIAVAVGGRTGSTYCATAHMAILKAMGIDDPNLDQLGVDHHFGGLSDADVAMLDYAVKITEAPDTITKDDIDRLHRLGFSDEQIFEIAFQAALMNFSSRMSLAIGAIPDMKPVEKAPVFR